jgi:hypothetical protein
MKLKSAFAAIAAATTLTGAVLLTAGQAQACIYSQKGGITDSAPSSSPTVDPTTTQANLGDLSKLGIVGAGFAVFGGLLAGGVFLKRRLDRKFEPLTEELQIEVLPNDLPEPLSEPRYVSSEFAIQVPPEVIRSLHASEEVAEESELTSV